LPLPALPIISGEECIRALERLGYAVKRQKGSHVRIECDGRSPVTVPKHSTLDRGTLRSIIRTVGISVEEFIDLLSALQ
jgi:predicted RNA binding protein YcfA (HicA-like mRNA interferase family)